MSKRGQQLQTNQLKPDTVYWLDYVKPVKGVFKFAEHDNKIAVFKVFGIPPYHVYEDGFCRMTAPFYEVIESVKPPLK